jgi:glutamate/tyrosine decarboxylase-like PLP-dependent enzyme
VKVDFDARLDIKDLERLLCEHVECKQAVYAVVAIIGTTEEGAVDPLNEILALRTKFQEEHGLSFVVHADAAWGGYFASMIPNSMYRSNPKDFVPGIPLCPSTITQLKHLGAVDSITIDPHKAGYIPYPAGALCYRDGRMRNLLTWTAPYIDQGEGESIGIYGVEGR